MNPNHDPKTGEFSDGGGGSGSLQHANASANAHDVNEQMKKDLLPTKWSKSPIENAREAERATLERGHEAVIYRNPKSNAIAIYSNTDGKIHINVSNKFWKDPVANSQRHAASGYLSSGDPEHIINHEIGHALYDPPNNFMSNHERDAIGKHVSKYAEMNPKEFVSEVHAGMKAGKQYPPEIMHLFQRYAKPRTER